MTTLRIIFALCFIYFCFFYKVAIGFIYRFVTDGHSYGYLKSIGWSLGIHLVITGFCAYFLFKKRAAAGPNPDAANYDRANRQMTMAAIFFGLFILSGGMVMLSLPHA